MDADEILPLTAETVRALLRARCAPSDDEAESDARRRRLPRWPFPGAAQFWIADETVGERIIIGTCVNLSERGMGVRVDEPLEVGLTLPTAVHQPEASYHGQATVRHCTLRPQGYFVGVEFVVA